MPETLVEVTIQFILAIVGAIIVLLLVNENRSMEKQLKDFRTPDTIMVDTCDTIFTQLDSTILCH